MPVPARRPSTLPLPASFLAIQIVQAATKPSANVNELAALCQNDPGFVARVLSYVNSAGFGINRRVTGVQHAVALLGIRGTKNLALAMCVIDMSPKGPAGDVLLAVCLRRAVAARLLAEKLSRPNIDDYFTLGLLLEIGLLVKARADLDGAAECARAPAAARVTVERSKGHEDHAVMGAKLARSWQLGEELANALLQHHDRHPPATSLIGRAAWLTELIAAVFESADASKSRVAAIEGAALVDVTAEQVDTVLKQIPSALSDAARHFGRDLGPQIGIDTLLRDANEALLELNRNYDDAVGRLELLVKEKEQLMAALKQADERLATLALTDPMTGLSNHRAFREALVRDLARADRSQTPLALIVLEADNFGQIADAQGGNAGDIVLCTMSDVLQRAVRTTDIPARVGGEKFALILPSTNVQGAMVVAERVRLRLLAHTFIGARGEFKVTASLGLAVTTGPGCRGREDAFLAAAEAGLANAKQAGRNRCMVGSL